MQKNDRIFLEESLILLENHKRRNKKTHSSAIIFFCLSILGIAIGFCSYFLFENGEMSGEIAAASTFFSELAEENEAIAVFLGLE